MTDQHAASFGGAPLSRDHSVIVAGGGPTGLMLAGELALAGVDVVVIEKRGSRALIGARAGGLHARSIEVLDQRGLADRFLAEGKVAQVAGFGGVMLDIGDFPTRHPYGLALWQQHIERLLGQWVDELHVPIVFGAEVTGLAQDDDGVDVTLSDGRVLRASYLVGADGGRSRVRKAAGIDFPGFDPTTSNLIAEAKLTETPPLGIRRDPIGIHGVSTLDDGTGYRLMITEQTLTRTGEPTLDDLREGLIAAYGSDFGVHDVRSLSRFTDMTRQAAAYRDRRVFVAGDAAHVHAPDGGQGLNTGLQDAVNLGWKLALVIQQIAPPSLLDTYHAERHPIAARALRLTMASVAIRRDDDRTKALRETIGELLALNEPRQHLAAILSGLEVHYDLGAGHPLLGRRMPDLDVVTAGGVVRVFQALHAAKPVLFDFGGVGAVDIAPWLERVDVVTGTTDRPWALPAIGAVTAPGAVLVRPDGYVCWVGASDQTGLREALTTWFGPPQLA